VAPVWQARDMIGKDLKSGSYANSERTIQLIPFSFCDNFK